MRPPGSSMAIGTPPNLLIAHNPANGAELGRVNPTSTIAVAEAIARARAAQPAWEAIGWSGRRAALRRLWGIMARDAEAWAGAIRDEVGKPSGEAWAEVVATLDALRWTVRHAGRALADERIGPGWQRLLLIPAARLRWRPFGVVGMIGTWNFPILLNAPPIAQALAAGNAVVWKPSEWASLAGERFRQNLEEAGIPEGLVATVFGGPEVGRALAEGDVDKGLFTGGIDNGRRVLADWAARGVPAIAELSGFDPAIILPDAPRESTVRALTWAAFVAAGQACVAVKRVYVVGGADAWAGEIAARARALRIGDPAEARVDLGPLISEAARDSVDRAIRAAVEAGARILAGGAAVPGPGWFYRPTVLLADDPGPEEALAGVFGPVVIVRGVADSERAIAAANAGRFGLGASVWGRDRRETRLVADRLDAGMVAINDAVSPSASAALPFGGIKASGFGRTRGRLGLREFVQPLTVCARSPGGFRPQLFPVSDRFVRLLALYRRFIHRNP